MWDVRTGRETGRLLVDGERVSSLAFGPSGDVLVSGGPEGTVRLWDPETGTEIRAWNNPDGPVLHVVFSPDGAWLASTGACIRLRHAASGKEAPAIPRRAGHAAFSPDGKRLAAAMSDKTVRLWDTATGKALLTLRGHTGRVRAVAFSLDGRWLASGGEGGVVRLWDTAAEKDLQERVSR